MTVDVELVALGLTAEDGVIVQHQAGHAGTRAPVENQRRGQAADAAPDDDAVMDFPGINGVGRQRVEDAVPDLVRLGEDIERVAVRGRVISDSARTIPVLRGGRLRQQLQRTRRQKARGGQKRRVEEIAPGDALIHAQRAVLRFVGRSRHVRQQRSIGARR